MISASLASVSKSRRARSLLGVPGLYEGGFGLRLFWATEISGSLPFGRAQHQDFFERRGEFGHRQAGTRLLVDAPASYPTIRLGDGCRGSDLDGVSKAAYFYAVWRQGREIIFLQIDGANVDFV